MVFLMLYNKSLLLLLCSSKINVSIPIKNNFEGVHHKFQIFFVINQHCAEKCHYEETAHPSFSCRLHTKCVEHSSIIPVISSGFWTLSILLAVFVKKATIASHQMQFL